MNILLLLAGAQPWRAQSALGRFTRVFVAIGVFSIEIQAVTWLHLGSLRTLPVVSLMLAVVAFVAWRPMPAADPARTVRFRDAVPLAAALAMAALVIALNLGLPFEAADPYHLEKIDRIERLGTLTYDPGTEAKVNVLSALYESLLADLRLVPVAGPLLARLHGLWGLLLYLVAIGAARELLPGPRTVSWAWTAALLVPTVFHQLVMVKNDLPVAVAGLVTLAWIVTRSSAAPWREVAWVSWLAGMAVAIKLTTLPLLVVLAGAVVIERWREPRAIAGLAAGALAGIFAGGLAFTLTENLRVYGDLMPVSDEGNRNEGPIEALIGLARFAVSLVDLGLVTRVVWPGRGGWGGTFGLPFIWSIAVVAWSSRRLPLARRTLLCAGIYFLGFATVFPDADVAQRLAMAPALLIVMVALSLHAGGELGRAWGRALALVVLLSSAQVARSALLYVLR
jgi:hypothetical protein